jgi:hypothetical protein
MTRMQELVFPFLRRLPRRYRILVSGSGLLLAFGAASHEWLSDLLHKDRDPTRATRKVAIDSVNGDPIAGSVLESTAFVTAAGGSTGVMVMVCARRPGSSAAMMETHVPVANRRWSASFVLQPNDDDLPLELLAVDEPSPTGHKTCGDLRSNQPGTVLVRPRRTRIEFAAPDVASPTLSLHGRVVAGPHGCPVFALRHTVEKAGERSLVRLGQAQPDPDGTWEITTAIRSPYEPATRVNLVATACHEPRSESELGQLLSRGLAVEHVLEIQLPDPVVERVGGVLVGKQEVRIKRDSPFLAVRGRAHNLLLSENLWVVVTYMSNKKAVLARQIARARTENGSFTADVPQVPEAATARISLAVGPAPPPEGVL